MHRDYLRGTAGFPSDDGCYAHSSPVPTLGHPGPPAKPPPSGFLKALLFLLLQGHGKARPQHSQTKSPSALSRFLNSYP